MAKTFYDKDGNTLGIFYTKEEIDLSKQDKLTAGTGITIDSNNVISAEGGGNPYIFSYAELANYVIGKHLSVDALVDLFEEKGIDDALINTCKNVALTTGRSIIGISIECDATFSLFNFPTIPLSVSGSTGYIDAIIAAKSDIENITFSLANITQWYAPEETPHGSPIISGYRAQFAPNSSGTIVTAFGKFTATTFDELKALFVETV